MADAAVIDSTRAALLHAAHDLLANEGPGALTVRRLAAAAGVSTMNVYSRFGGKDGVLDELFIDGFTRLSDAMGTPRTDDPIADLDAVGEAYLEFARTSPTYYSLMFDKVVPEYRPGPAACLVAEGTFAQLVAAVDRSMAAGRLRRGDAVTTAAGLWAHVHGLASLTAISREIGGPEALADADWRAIAETSLAAHIAGLAAPAGDAR